MRHQIFGVVACLLSMGSMFAAHRTRPQRPTFEVNLVNGFIVNVAARESRSWVLERYENSRYLLVPMSGFNENNPLPSRNRVAFYRTANDNETADKERSILTDLSSFDERTCFVRLKRFSEKSNVGALPNGFFINLDDPENRDLLSMIQDAGWLSQLTLSDQPSSTQSAPQQTENPGSCCNIA